MIARKKILDQLRRLNGVTARYLPAMARPESAAPSGRTLYGIFPGLKPWAEGYSPFGAHIFPTLSQRYSALYLCDWQPHAPISSQKSADLERNSANPHFLITTRYPSLPAKDL